MEAFSLLRPLLRRVFAQALAASVLLAATCWGQAPAGVSLPPGMTPAQAQLIAGQNGITVGADGAPELPPGMTAEQARSLARGNAASLGADAGGIESGSTPGGLAAQNGNSLDPNEGAIENTPVEDDLVVERSIHSDEAGLRWGQKLFRSGVASLASGHVGAIGPEYGLGPGDELILTLWGQKEARYSLTLDRDGQVSIEFVGVVSLNGQTLKSAETLLRKRLSKVYAGLADGTTQMDLTMGKLKQIRVFVVGDVVQPGSFMLSGNTSVLAALFMARGPTSLGTERRIEIRRGSRVVTVDLYDYLARGRRPDQDVLRDGDVVRVGRHLDVVEVQGSVGRPGFYELLPEEGAKELLQYAGGVGLLAADQPLAVVRTFQGGRRDVVLLRKPSDYKAGQNSDLEDQDQVMVYLGNDPTQATIVASGEFRYPGPYPWTPGMTLASLLERAGGPSPSVVPGLAFVRRVRSDGSVTFTRARYDSASGAARLLLPLDTVTLLNRFQFTEGGAVSIRGAVRQPREVGFRPGMTLRDLVLLAGGFDKVQPPPSLQNPQDSLEQARVDTSGLFDLDSLLWFPAGEAFVQRRTADGLGKIQAFALSPVPEIPLAEGDVVQIVDRLANNALDSIRVTGMVAHPGTQPDFDGLRVRDAILRAGGFLPNSDPSAVRLEYPRDSTGSFSETLRLDSSLTVPEAFRLLPRGAQVAVPRRLDKEALELIHLRGEFVRPGSYSIQEEGERLSSFVRRSGGVTSRAFPPGASLVRTDMVGHGRIVIDMAKAIRKPGSRYDPVMRVGDSLLVPRLPSTVRVVGEVNRPGLVSWREGLSYRDYITLAGGFKDSADEDGVFVEQVDGRVQTRRRGIDKPLPGSTIEVPFKVPPESITFKEVIGGVNAVLATVIAGLTIFVLLNK